MFRSTLSNKLSTFGVSASRRSTLLGSSRTFNFASSEYNNAVHGSSPEDKYHPVLPVPNFNDLRSRTLNYIDGFDKQVWFDQPIVSVLDGEKLYGGKTIDTTDAFGNVNGKIIHANKEEVEKLIAHINKISPGKKTDFR